MSTYGNERALTISPPDSYPIQQWSQQQTHYNNSISATINSHAAMIDELNKRMGDMVAFIEWVGNTHPHVLQEHQAIKDLEEASK